MNKVRKMQQLNKGLGSLTINFCPANFEKKIARSFKILQLLQNKTYLLWINEFLQFLNISCIKKTWLLDMHLRQK